MMDALSLVFNYVPSWVWTVIAVVLLAVFWQPAMALWLGAPKWLKGLILGAGALLTAYVGGCNKGSKDERDRRVKADAHAIQNRKDVDDEVRNLPADDLDRRLDKWMRD